MYSELQAPTIFLPDFLYQAYPAHLHIDIKPRGQGQGNGKRLMDALLAELTRQGRCFG